MIAASSDARRNLGRASGGPMPPLPSSPWQRVQYVVYVFAPLSRSAAVGFWSGLSAGTWAEATGRHAKQQASASRRCRMGKSASYTSRTPEPQGVYSLSFVPPQQETT